MPNESENTRSTISNIRKMLSQAEKGGVQNTIQNCVTVLQNDPVLADSIRLNLLSERIDIVKPMGWQRSGPTLTDTDMMYILRRMENTACTAKNGCLQQFALLPTKIIITLSGTT